MDINDATDLVESLVYAVVEYEDMCAKGRDAGELETQYEKQQEITKQLIAALTTTPNQPHCSNAEDYEADRHKRVEECGREIMEYINVKKDDSDPILFSEICQIADRYIT